MASVLGGDKCHLAKYTQRPGADVLQIADRRGDDIKRTHSGIRTTAGSHRAYLKQEMRIVARFTAATSRPSVVGYNRPTLAVLSGTINQWLAYAPPSPLRRHPARSLLQLPSSTLGELPRTPQASTQQLLKQAEQSDAEQAAQLRGSCRSEHSAGQPRASPQYSAAGPTGRTEACAADFRPDAAGRNRTRRRGARKAEQALQHPSFERLGELPVSQQIRSQLARAQALEANNKPLAAARERVFTAPLLSGEQAQANHETIWKLLSALPEQQLQGAADTDLAGWQALALSLKRAGTIAQQQRAIDDWIAQNPQHPAAQQFPESLQKLRELADQPLNHVALLLPMEGQLASVARALRDGFGCSSARTAGRCRTAHRAV